MAAARVLYLAGCGRDYEHFSLACWRRPLPWSYTLHLHRTTEREREKITQFEREEFLLKGPRCSYTWMSATHFMVNLLYHCWEISLKITKSVASDHKRDRSSSQMLRQNCSHTSSAVKLIRTETIPSATKWEAPRVLLTSLILSLFHDI